MWVKWIKKQPRGISLLEVLAAIFVIAIGLLGVLAVIPFGAFQVSKANHAEFASNMLADAAEEFLIREMANPIAWGVNNTLLSAGTVVFTNQTLPEDSTLNCTRFIWVEPRVMFDPPAHIFCIGATFKPDTSDHPTNNWTEWMTGQDDILFTYHSNKRPDLTDQPGGRIQSSGRYTWFFTFQPRPVGGFTGNRAAVPLNEVNPHADIDILACHNRVPTDDAQVPNVEFVPSSGGGRFTFPDTEHLELLTQTKYVFVTWREGRRLNGAWCKILFLDKDEHPVTALRNPKIVVTGSLPDSPGNDMRVYIPSGVLYHKRLEGVRIM